MEHSDLGGNKLKHFSFSKAYTRRDFLTWLTGLFIGVASLFTGATLFKFAQPPSRSLDGKIKIGWIAVVKAEVLVEGRPKLVEYGDDRIYLVKTVGKIRAYNASCPHVGCKLKWNDKGKSFICPCHRSSFTLNGVRLGGPSPRDMFAMKVAVKKGMVWIGGDEDVQGTA